MKIREAIRKRNLLILENQQKKCPIGDKMLNCAFQIVEEMSGTLFEKAKEVPW